MFGPNITGEFPNNDNEYEKYYSGAFSIGSVKLSGYSDGNDSAGQTGLFHQLTDPVRLSNPHLFARFSALNLDAEKRPDGGRLHGRRAAVNRA